MSRKFTAKITEEELACQIVNAMAVREDFDRDGEAVKANSALKFLDKNSGGYTVRGLLKFLTPIVKKDLNKVQFDTENIEYEKGEGH